jgi:hypothetical protein
LPYNPPFREDFLYPSYLLDKTGNIVYDVKNENYGVYYG